RWDEPQASWGTAPHVAAASETGAAAVYADQGKIWVQRLGAAGALGGSPNNVSIGFMPLVPSNPAIAALPDGGYAIAWTDGIAGNPDVRLRVLGSALGGARLAHDDSAGFQQDPDLLWVRDRLIVSWTDLLQVKYRAFGSDLTPMGPAQSLATSPAIES